MDQTTLEINLTSAKDLKDVNFISKMDVYAVISISSDGHLTQKTKTPVDRDGGKNPSWNFPAKFTMNKALLAQNRLTLVVQLTCERALGDKDVGEVNVPIKELLDSFGDGKSMKFISYQVRKPSGKPKGELHFSFKFSEKAIVPAESATAAAKEPVSAYPSGLVVGPSSGPYGGPGPYPPPPPQGYGHPPQPPYGGYPPPPPPGYGYPPPPPPGYGYAYPPVQGGYGYPPPPMQVQQPPMQAQQPPKKNNKFGMGLGAGLVGGALGGLLIGDLVSDAAAYDSGYDAGFGDAGGFGF